MASKLSMICNNVFSPGGVATICSTAAIVGGVIASAPVEIAIGAVCLAGIGAVEGLKLLNKAPKSEASHWPM